MTALHLDACDDSILEHILEALVGGVCKDGTLLGNIEGDIKGADNEFTVGITGGPLLGALEWSLVGKPWLANRKNGKRTAGMI